MGTEERREYDELRRDYYTFKEAQIERNTSCDLQIGQHDKDINYIKAILKSIEKVCSDCATLVLPEMKLSSGKVVGAISVVGVLFTVLIVMVGSAKSDSSQAQALANSAKADISLIQNDMTYVRRDINAMRDDIKDLTLKISRLIEKEDKK